ncbi:hypothetical protein BU17DRAFT_68109 [Hysterangium stoloniferum]|nr:hypothetical protein BU17DRAFT_68109 [Hysterangium stoloniferum]
MNRPLHPQPQAHAQQAHAQTQPQPHPSSSTSCLPPPIPLQIHTQFDDHAAAAALLQIRCSGSPVSGVVGLPGAQFGGGGREAGVGHNGRQGFYSPGTATWVYSPAPGGQPPSHSQMNMNVGAASSSSSLQRQLASYLPPEELQPPRKRKKMSPAPAPPRGASPGSNGKGKEREVDVEFDGDEKEQTQDEGVMRCICELQLSSGFTIQCESCHVWQHGTCMRIRPNHVPEVYLCERCNPRAVDGEGARKRMKKALEGKRRAEKRSANATTNEEGKAVGVGEVNGKGEGRKVARGRGMSVASAGGSGRTSLGDEKDKDQDKREKRRGPGRKKARASVSASASGVGHSRGTSVDVDRSVSVAEHEHEHDYERAQEHEQTSIDRDRNRNWERRRGVSLASIGTSLNDHEQDPDHDQGQDQDQDQEIDVEMTSPITRPGSGWKRTKTRSKTTQSRLPSSSPPFRTTRPTLQLLSPLDTNVGLGLSAASGSRSAYGSSQQSQHRRDSQKPPNRTLVRRCHPVVHQAIHPISKRDYLAISLDVGGGEGSGSPSPSPGSPGLEVDLELDRGVRDRGGLKVDDDEATRRGRCFVNGTSSAMTTTTTSSGANAIIRPILCSGSGFDQQLEEDGVVGEQQQDDLEPLPGFQSHDIHARASNAAHHHHQHTKFYSTPNAENTSGISLGIFALRDMKKGEEVVLGWEWRGGDDDDESGEKTGSSRDVGDMHGSTFVAVSPVVAALLASFTTCACGGSLSHCALQAQAQAQERLTANSCLPHQHQHQHQEDSDGQTYVMSPVQPNVSSLRGDGDDHGLDPAQDMDRDQDVDKKPVVEPVTAGRKREADVNGVGGPVRKKSRVGNEWESWSGGGVVGRKKGKTRVTDATNKNSGNAEEAKARVKDATTSSAPLSGSPAPAPASAPSPAANKSKLPSMPGENALPPKMRKKWTGRTAKELDGGGASPGTPADSRDGGDEGGVGDGDVDVEMDDGIDGTTGKGKTDMGLALGLDVKMNRDETALLSPSTAMAGLSLRGTSDDDHDSHPFEPILPTPKPNASAVIITVSSPSPVKVTTLSTPTSTSSTLNNMPLLPPSADDTWREPSSSEDMPVPDVPVCGESSKEMDAGVAVGPDVHIASRLKAGSPEDADRDRDMKKLIAPDVPESTSMHPTPSATPASTHPLANPDARPLTLTSAPTLRPSTTLTPVSPTREPSPPAPPPPPPVQAPPRLSLSDWKIRRERERKEREERERSDKEKENEVGAGPGPGADVAKDGVKKDDEVKTAEAAAATIPLPPPPPVDLPFMDIDVDLKEMDILKAGIQRLNDSGQPTSPCPVMAEPSTEPSVATHTPPELTSTLRPEETTIPHPEQPVASMEQPFKFGLSVDGPVPFTSPLHVSSRSLERRTPPPSWNACERTSSREGNAAIRSSESSSDPVQHPPDSHMHVPPPSSASPSGAFTTSPTPCSPPLVSLTPHSPARRGRSSFEEGEINGSPPQPPQPLAAAPPPAPRAQLFNRFGQFSPPPAPHNRGGIPFRSQGRGFSPPQSRGFSPPQQRSFSPHPSSSSLRPASPSPTSRPVSPSAPLPPHAHAQASRPGGIGSGSGPPYARSPPTQPRSHYHRASPPYRSSPPYRHALPPAGNLQPSADVRHGRGGGVNSGSGSGQSQRQGTNHQSHGGFSSRPPPLGPRARRGMGGM